MGDSQNFNTRFDGPLKDARLGQSIAYGDINGDGFQDLIVAAYRNSANNRLNSGSVFIIFGKGSDSKAVISDLNNPANYDVRIDGIDKKNQLGRSVASGDLNNDNFDDILIGANTSNTNGKLGSGSVFVIHGSANFGLQKIRDLEDQNNYSIRFDGALRNDRLGEKVLSGDVNGDGFDDIIMSAALANNDESQDLGSIYIVYGNNSSGTGVILDLSESTSYNKVYTGSAKGDSLGASLAGGDLNGDGFIDLMVGAPYQNTDLRVDNGSIFIIYGKDENPNGLSLSLADQNNYDMRFYGTATNDVLGLSGVCSDFNGDGLDDMILGAAGSDFNSRNRSGSFYLINGSTLPVVEKDIDLTLVNNFNLRFDGAAADELLGLSVSSNDINGDGFHDLLFGSYYADYNDSTNSGSVYVIYGNNSYTSAELLDLQSSTNFDLRYDGTFASDNFGRSTSGVDFNADGFGDIVSSAFLATNNDSLESGSIYHISNEVTGEPAAIPHYLSAGDRPNFLMRDENISVDFSTGSDGLFHVQRKMSKPASDYPDNTAQVSWVLSSEKGTITNTQISLKYNADQITGLDENNLKIFYRVVNSSSHSWHIVPNSSHSIANNTITFSVDSLSEFTIGDRNNISNHYPTITTTEVDSATEDQDYIFTLEASDPDNDNLSFVKISGPIWLSVSTSGVLTGRPNLSHIGTFPLQIKLTDDGVVQLSDTLFSQITVIEVNDNPVITTTSLINGIEDIAYTDTVFATDEESAILTFSALDVPVWMDVSANGSLSGFPLNEHSGTAIPVKITVTDEGAAKDTLQTTINVININDAPVLSPISGETVDEGSAFTAIDLKLFTQDIDNTFSELQWTVTENPDISVIINTNGVASLSANDENWNGDNTIKFKVTDPGSLSDSVSVLFRVNPVNDAPVVSAIPNQTIDEGTEFEPIHLNDFVHDVDNADSEINWDHEGDIELSILIDANNIARISIPDSNWFGSETIKFTATDPSFVTDFVNVIFTVTNIPDAPVMTDIPSQNIMEGASFQTIFLDNFIEDIDTPKDQIVWTKSGNSDLIVLINEMNQASVSTPDSNWFGFEEIIFKATDPDNLSDQSEVLFTVNNINDSPQFITTSLPNAAEDSSYVVQLETFDVDDILLTVTKISAPTWMAVSSSGLLSGMPLNSDTGEDQQVTVVVSDPLGLKDTLSTTMDVVPVNDAPVILGVPDVTFEEDDSTSIDLLDYVSDEDNELHELIFLAEVLVPESGVNVTVTDGHLVEIIPDENVFGDFPIRFIVNDPGGLSAVDTVIVHIMGVDDPPVFITSILPDALEDQLFIDTLFVQETDGDTLVFTAQKLPNWISVSTDGLLTGLPLVSDIGTNQEVIIRVSDMISEDTLITKINVIEVNDFPVIENVPDIIFNEDDSILIDLSIHASDEESPNESLSFGVEIFSGETLSASIINHHFVRIVPQENLFGNFQIGFTVKDPEGLTALDTVKIKIKAINDAPIISSIPNIVFDEDGNYALDLNAFVHDVDNPNRELKVSSRVLSGVSQLLNYDDSLSLAIVFSSLENVFGEFDVEINISDPGGLQALDTISVKISAINDRPVIDKIPVLSILEDVPFILENSYFDPFISDIDNPKDSLNLVFISNVLSAQIDLNNLTISSPENWFGKDSLLVVVNDPGGKSDSTYWPINVTAVNDKPVVSFVDELQIVNDKIKAINLYENVEDIDNSIDEISWSFFSDTSAIVLSQNQDSLFINVSEIFGEFRLFLIATDARGLADTATINLVVSFPVSKYDQNGDGVPEKYVLFQNYPNPFNATTTISYGLPSDSRVKIEIFNTVGQKIETLFSGNQTAGFHEVRWTTNISSGIYFYRISSKGKKNFTKIKKMFLIR
ncbi:MAG: tandem-95 repeat protein [Calditrichaeota bacterium]|nr:tandem-95 repeat protein [Calditrichota bacterium]